jgi:hypothetical protein
MGQNTPSSASGIRPYRSPYGHFPGRSYPEAGASTFHAGNVVEPSTVGSTASHRVALMSSLSANILGVAGEVASGVIDTPIPVYEARPEIEFKGWVKEVIASSLVWDDRSLAYDSTLGIHYLAVNATAGDQRVVITEVGSTAGGPEQQLAGIGDTQGYVAFKFIADFSMYGKST